MKRFIASALVLLFGVTFGTVLLYAEVDDGSNGETPVIVSPIDSNYPPPPPGYKGIWPPPDQPLYEETPCDTCKEDGTEPWHDPLQ
jgi:hypothetical protein